MHYPHPQTSPDPLAIITVMDVTFLNGTKKFEIKR